MMWMVTVALECCHRVVHPLLRGARRDLLEVEGAAHYLPVPQPPLSLLTPLLSVAPGQLLAWALAQAKGFDPDQPNGLSKVTLAR